MHSILQFTIILLQTCMSDALLFPPPAGPYGINVQTMQLTDHTRKDPFAPHPTPRSLMISAFYPAAKASDCKVKPTAYMPNVTADYINADFEPLGVPQGALRTVQLSLCERQASFVAKTEFPLVLFSPGMGESRLLYSFIAQSVASYGFVVVTMDHPYDANIVEYPGGNAVLAANLTTLPEIGFDVEVRAKDVSFILDQLKKAQVSSELCLGQHKAFNTEKVGIFGHSLGGATAASAMANDTRLIGGINLDGELFGPVISSGLKQPFLFMESERNSTLDTWTEIYPHLDWKLELELLNSSHGTYTDQILLAELLFGDPLPPPVAELVGSIPGARALDIVTQYCVAFLDMVLKCRSTSLLQRPSEAFPEIVFVQ